MPYSDFHNLNRRSVTLEPSVLAAIVAGVVAVNFVVLAGWYIVKKRARSAERRNEHSGRSLESGSLDDMLHDKTYTSRQSPSALGQRQQHKPIRIKSKSRLGRSRRGQVQERPMETHSRRSAEADSASVYSSVSAPLEFHDLLFRTQPFAFDPTSPRWIVPKEPSHAASPDFTRGSLALLQSLMPISPLSTDDKSETMSRLIDQIDRLNQPPSFSQTLAIASADHDPIQIPACAYMRSGTTANEASSHSVDFAYVSTPCCGGSRSSPAVTPLRVSSQVDHPTSDLAKPRSPIPNTEPHQSSFRAASQQLTSSPPRVIWKQ